MSDHSRVEEIFLAALECRNPHDWRGLSELKFVGVTLS